MYDNYEALYVYILGIVKAETLLLKLMLQIEENLKDTSVSEIYFLPMGEHNHYIYI